jgi:Fis family transcriptional regulator
MLDSELALATLASRSPQQTHQSLRNSVETALQHYFSQLGGLDPANVYSMVLEQMEVPLLKAVLKYTRGNQCKAATVLGISRGTLRKKIHQYNLD